MPNLKHDHISCLQCILNLWEKGDISNLLKEGRALQKSLASFQPSKRETADDASTARRFSKMMRVRAALRLLSSDSHTGLLRLDETIDTSGKDCQRCLEDKHPDPKPTHPEALLGDAVDSFHPIIVESITADSIRTAALHTQGAAGPSGLDAIN